MKIDVVKVWAGRHSSGIQKAKGSLESSTPKQSADNHLDNLEWRESRKAKPLLSPTTQTHVHKKVITLRKTKANVKEMCLNAIH